MNESAFVIETTKTTTAAATARHHTKTHYVVGVLKRRQQQQLNHQDQQQQQRRRRQSTFTGRTPVKAKTSLANTSLARLTLAKDTFITKAPKRQAVTTFTLRLRRRLQTTLTHFFRSWNIFLKLHLSRRGRDLYRFSSQLLKLQHLYNYKTSLSDSLVGYPFDLSCCLKCSCCGFSKTLKQSFR